MSQKELLPLALDSAQRCLNDPTITPGELVGSALGSAYGPLGSFLGGTVGRMLESHWSDASLE
ncbi:MAG: hypothetical protein ACXV8Q_04010 [Methylobacter sp.]